MSECTHNCDTCGEQCSDKEKSLNGKEPVNAMSRVKKVIAVVSGKGGVGKSMVTGLLASAVRKVGQETAILDADITGPSIPKMFGVNARAEGCEYGILPQFSKNGIKLMSLNLLLEHETDPVVWRGMMIANTVKQFWTDVVWDQVDVMFLDMPPGTGDVPLTVFQSLPVDGVIVVSTPQDLVEMIVAKAIKMAEMMNVPVIGMVENMSGYICPDCGKRIDIFGKSKAKELAERYGIEHFACLPIQPELAAQADEGRIEEADCSALDEMAAAIVALPVKEA